MKKERLEEEEGFANSESLTALTNSTFVVQLKIASMEPEDRTLNLYVQNV